jgi:hypothetical protein
MMVIWGVYERVRMRYGRAGWWLLWRSRHLLLWLILELWTQLAEAASREIDWEGRIMVHRPWAGGRLERVK